MVIKSAYPFERKKISYVLADQRLNDIVGSAYYVAPEVLHRAYSVEADMWSIGVITYILMCGSRPFWARTESGIFRSVLRADPNFDDSPWPDVSAEGKDFVKRLLNKDHRKRMTAVQALSNCFKLLRFFRVSFFALSLLYFIHMTYRLYSFAAHPWLRDESRSLPLDISIYKLVKAYIRASPLKRAALKVIQRLWVLLKYFPFCFGFNLIVTTTGYIESNNRR